MSGTSTFQWHFHEFSLTPCFFLCNVLEKTAFITMAAVSQDLGTKICLVCVRWERISWIPDCTGGDKGRSRNLPRWSYAENKCWFCIITWMRPGRLAKLVVRRHDSVHYPSWNVGRPSIHRTAMQACGSPSIGEWWCQSPERSPHLVVQKLLVFDMMKWGLF